MSSKRRQQGGDVQGQGREKLSLGDFRKLLAPNCGLSDAEILRMRDQMYNAAQLVVSLAPNRAARESIEERAAIMEFDGGLSSEAAGREAVIGHIRGRQ